MKAEPVKESIKTEKVVPAPTKAPVVEAPVVQVKAPVQNAVQTKPAAQHKEQVPAPTKEVKPEKKKIVSVYF